MFLFCFSPCPEAQCQSYFSSSGVRCKGRKVTYRGACVDPGNIRLCGGRLGRRLIADLHGAYSCKCSRQLGYLESLRECYVQFSRGPCHQGEQLEPGEGKPVCKKNPCRAGYYHGLDRMCHSVAAWEMITGYEQLTGLEKKDRSTIIAATDTETAVTYCTFCNEHCARRSLAGDCLNTTSLPEVPHLGQEDLIWALGLSLRNQQ